MIPRTVAAGALAVAVIVIGYVLLSSGPSPYVLKFEVADANGLRQGSPVAIAGQDVGTIHLGVRDGRVLVTLDLDRSDAPVGRDVTASIAAVNLLGQKRVQITKGNGSDPAPSGYTIPSSRVSVSTDLDQVLDVLTPDTRARLAILINEAGQALTGRRADFSQLLEQLPHDLSAGTELVGGIATDNHTLANLVQTSDGFVTELARQRAALVRVVDAAGQAAVTVQARRVELSQTLARAPQTLATMQRFLGKLQVTAIALGPAARDVTATAPALTGTLAQLDPFRRAADPTLTEATEVAPELSRLDSGATPVIERANPVVASLAVFSRALQPVSVALSGSVDNLVAILQNWARAIQFRDGLSHVFRADISFSPDTILTLIDRLAAAGGPTAARRLRGAKVASPLKLPQLPSALARHRSPRAPASAATPVAGRTTSSGAAPPPSSSTPPSKSTGASSLTSLLSYLLRP